MQEYVSVIIPVYNRKALLKRAVTSVLNQSYKYFEIIIVDDSSKENLDDVIKDFNDERLKLLMNKKNMGVSYSRNFGIKESSYDLIAFLDSDDKWLKNKLKMQIDFLNNNMEINVVHTEEIWIRNGLRVNQKKKHKKTGGDIFIPSLDLCLMSPSSIMMKKCIFEKYGYFDESLPVCEDYDMWLRITSNEEVGFIDEPMIIKYGGHKDQLSRKYEAMDKYRVISMMKLLKSKLNQNKKNALLTVINKKLHILINGAVKRNKNDDVVLYKSWFADINSLI